MKPFKHHTLKEFSDTLSLKTPVPGGGSAAALVGVLGVSLISMTANYSRGKGLSKLDEKKIRDILAKSEKIRKRILELVDLDARAYLGVVKTRQARPAVKKKALKKAREVPFEVAQLCYSALELTPYLVRKGNKHLLSDVRVAAELLLAAFRSALINVEINQ